MTYSVGKHSGGIELSQSSSSPRAPELRIAEYLESGSSFVPKSMVLAPGHVKVIKKGVLIHPSMEFSLEELEDCKGLSLEMSKSRSEQELSISNMQIKHDHQS
jgi:hypothetical protein